MGLLWLQAFLLTQGAELLLAWVCLRSESYSRSRILAVVALGNCLTHPTLWFLLPHLFPVYDVYLVVGETLVVLAEAVILRLGLKGLSLRRALLVSLTINAGSYVIGALLSASRG
jgi:hypothetical protein